MKILLRVALVAGCVGLAIPCSAQIYTWRDASGHLVMSDHPQGGARRSYSVAESDDSVRTTRYVPADRSTRYDDLVRENARANGVRTDLVRAVVQVESAFNPFARSPKGALGLMQLMPSTIQQFGVRNPFDPVENIRAGVAYLRQLLERYSNNEQLALAAYNAGPAAVDRHGQTIPPYKETRDYVLRVNHAAGRPLQLRNQTIYKSVDVVDGREIPSYSDHKPAGTYEVVASRQSSVGSP